MAKSKGRLLAELLASDGKVKESRSALDISGGKLAPSDIPILPNSKLENSSISIAGHSTSLGGSVTLNTGDISEHTNYKYYTEARVRAAISASGDLSYNSSTGVISFSASASPVISVNSETGSVVLDTGDVAENGNLYHTTARARSAISATGSLSYNSTTGVISFTMPAQNTSNITEGSNLYYTNARADARIAAADTGDLSEGSNLYHTTARARAAISASGNAISYNSSTGVISSTFEESPSFTTVTSSSYKIGTTTVIDSSRNFIANARLTFDYNDYYLEPGTGNLSLKNASNAALVTLGQESQFNGTVTVNSHVSGIGDINFGKAITGHNTSSPARITAGSAGQLYIDSTQNQHIYLGWYNNSSYDIISEMNARFASYKDRSDTAYFVNPAGASNIRNLVIKGTTSDSSTDALHIRNSGGTSQSYFRNDGTVVIGGSQYLYVTAGGGAYFSNSIKARGGIHNDQGDLLLNDNVAVSGYTNMTGQLSFTANNTAIRMRDSAGAYTRTMILNGSNTMYIGPVDAYAGGSILYGASSNVSGQTFYVGGNARLAVTGSGITVTGTITGDITGSLSGTATQASNLNNHNTGNLSEGSNLYYTDARVGTYLSNNGYATQSTIVAAITDSAPTTLDTLNELAAALGDDANFSTTVTNSIATKAPLANPSLTGNTSIAGNLVMSNSTSEIRLGSYLKLHGATGSNTATLSVNATYDGAQTDSWTPGYSGDVNAGMFMLRQFSGGSGTMQVYQKKHGTTSSSTGRGTFTKTAEFNHDGYFYGRNLRSERYYSSDNTAYYTDPSETSVIKQILINGASNNSGKADFAVGAGGDPQVSWNGNQVQIGGTDMNWNGKINYGSNIFSMAAWDANIQFFSQGGTTSRNIVFKPSNAGTATERLTIHGDNGAVIASSQMRAPIFYDSDNTNYYSNPGSTSVFNALTLSTLNATTLNVSGNTQLGNGSGDITHINDIVHIGATDSGDSDLYFGEGSTNNIRYGVHWDWDSGYRFTWNTRNNGTDSTLFYYDTNSTSYIHWGRSHHIANNDINYVNQLHFNDDVRFLDEGNSSYLRYKSGHTTTGGIKYYNGSDALQGFVYFDNAGFGLLSADGSWGVRTWNSGTHIYHSTRSPVYYDSDDTTYYVDPNHTTTSAKFAGNVQHTGLTMTSGSDVDQLYTVTVSAQLTTSWQDTGINGGDLSTGTYIVQIYADGDVPRYHYSEYYSGVMSWYNASTNSNEVDEITLHRAGHAPNDGNIFLRTLRHPSGGDNLMLQLRSTHNSTSASNYIFKFRRMI